MRIIYIFLVVLIGSAQDNYAPLESSLIQLSERTDKLNHSSELVEMSSNVLKRLQDSKVHRVRVNFAITEKSIDTFIGRKAHIEFIDNEEVASMIVSMFPTIFE